MYRNAPKLLVVLKVAETRLYVPGLWPIALRDSNVHPILRALDLIVFFLIAHPLNPVLRSVTFLVRKDTNVVMDRSVQRLPAT